MPTLLSREIRKVILQLLLSMPQETKQRLLATPEEDILSQYHFGLGLYIRNEFLLPDTLLYKAFCRNGIKHTDDMSILILHELYSTLIKQATSTRR